MTLIYKHNYSRCSFLKAEYRWSTAWLNFDFKACLSLNIDNHRQLFYTVERSWQSQLFYTVERSFRELPHNLILKLKRKVCKCEFCWMWIKKRNYTKPPISGQVLVRTNEWFWESEWSSVMLSHKVLKQLSVS